MACWECTGRGSFFAIATLNCWCISLIWMGNLMNFVESRLLGVKVDDSGRKISLSITCGNGDKVVLDLHGIERFLVHEMRQQNIIENLTHWEKGEQSIDLREAAYFLMTGMAEIDCESQMGAIANSAIDRVMQGELEILEITAVFGAQVIASFKSLTVRLEN